VALGVGSHHRAPLTLPPRSNGHNPDKARGVDITNAEKFVLHGALDMPGTLLHELCHAYHDHGIGLDSDGDAELAAEFAKAAESGRYDSVLRANNKEGQAHYALTNKFEYV
jgi:hypothetical protein